MFGGDEFATEGLAEERLREAVDVRLSQLQPGLDLVREREQLFDATHDFLLLGQRRERKRVVFNAVRRKIRLGRTIVKSADKFLAIRTCQYVVRELSVSECVQSNDYQ